jgi:hypothetical protein
MDPAVLDSIVATPGGACPLEEAEEVDRLRARVLAFLRTWPRPEAARVLERVYLDGEAFETVQPQEGVGREAVMLCRDELRRFLS